MHTSSNIFGILIGVLACVALVFADFKMPTSAAESSYLRTFYVAGHMFLEGKSKELYLPPGASAFAGTPIDREAHKLNPSLPQTSSAEFVEAPILALLFAPFALLPPQWSLLLFQALSLVALALATESILETTRKGEGDLPQQAAALSLTALIFFPLLLSIWLGQSAVVFGMLPLAFGLRLLLTKRPIQAGLVLSLCLLKPQFLIPALFLATAMVVGKRPKCFISMCWGMFVILLLNFVIFGSDTMLSWLNALKSSESVYSDFSSIIAANLGCGLVHSTLPLISANLRATLAPAIYGFGIFIGILGYITALRLAQAELKDEVKLSAIIIMGIFITPLAVPHIFLSDYSIYYIAGLLAMTTRWSPARKWEFKSITRMSWLIIDAYMVAVVVVPQYAYALILILFMLVLYPRLLEVVETMRVKDAVETVPMATY
jgi:hypothetical protein